MPAPDFTEAPHIREVFSVFVPGWLSMFNENAGITTELSKLKLVERDSCAGARDRNVTSSI
jgi:hypothetical protein